MGNKHFLCHVVAGYMTRQQYGVVKAQWKNTKKSDKIVISAKDHGEAKGIVIQKLGGALLASMPDWKIYDHNSHLHGKTFKPMIKHAVAKSITEAQALEGMGVPSLFGDLSQFNATPKEKPDTAFND